MTSSSAQRDPARGSAAPARATPTRASQGASAGLVDDFVRYLRSERNRSEHTVRAYASDVTHLGRDLAAHRRSVTPIDERSEGEWAGDERAKDIADSDVEAALVAATLVDLR